MLWSMAASITRMMKYGYLVLGDQIMHQVIINDISIHKRITLGPKKLIYYIDIFKLLRCSFDVFLHVEAKISRSCLLLVM